MRNMHRIWTITCVAIGLIALGSPAFAAKKGGSKSSLSRSSSTATAKKASAMSEREDSGGHLVKAEAPTVVSSVDPKASVGKKPSKLDDLVEAGPIVIVAGETEWEISTGISDSFGSSYFGASYDLGASLAAATAAEAGTDGDLLEAEAHLKAHGTVFSTKKEVFATELEAYTEYGEDYGGSIDVRVLGASIWSKSKKGSLNLHKDWGKIFFEKCKTFWVGPVPVSVCGSAGGELGFDLTGGIQIYGIGAEFTPYGMADAYASAGVGVAYDGWIEFGVGAEGHVVLIDVSVPVEADLELGGGFAANSVDWSVDVDIDIETVSGEIWAYAVAKIFGIGPEYEKKIFDWSGSSWNKDLFSEDGSFLLGSSTKGPKLSFGG